jgi:cob(I)alamin adenosyltransferase
MKIYTRTGDAGTTALMGGERVAKNHTRIEAYGTVDETNSCLGLARAHLSGQPGAAHLDALLDQVQHELFVLGADLATAPEARPLVPRVSRDDVAWLEQQIDALDAALPALKHFILPGGTAAAAALHLARTVCRRAERLTVELSKREPLNEQGLIYLNRLSDFLFVAARWVNRQAGVEEALWNPRTPRNEPNPG